MAQAGDKFDEMTNSQLRDQLELFGLPKVPVTASTRNILIKRLRNHVKDAGSKVRRETIHVVKYSSDEESDKEAAKEKLKKKLENHKQARRATIGGAGATSAIPVPEKPTRKSGRMTPTKATTTKTDTSVRVAAHVPIIVEDSDEDLADIPLPTSRPDRRSKSKTPTLAKSDIITTSYKQVVDTVREEEEEAEESMEEEVVVQVPRYKQQETIEPRVTQRSSYLDNISRSSPMKTSIASRDSPLRRTTMGGYGQQESSSSRYNQPSVFSRPSLATTYGSTYNSYSSTYRRRDNNDEESDNLEELPYLSEFSKRLSQLKADPLTSTTTDIKPLKRESVYRSGMGTSKRTSPSFWDSIVAYFVGLENKYKLKTKIFILAMILLAIFILVLFWN